MAQNLIIRYRDSMKKISATEASREFSDLLDAVEDGESVTITRGNNSIAEIRPATQKTGRDLRIALEKLPPVDDDFEKDIVAALEPLTPWERDPRAEN